MSQHNPIEDLFSTPLPSTTPEGIATIETATSAIAEGAESIAKLAEQSQANLEQVLDINAKAHAQAAKTRDFNAEIAAITRNNSVATADLNKAPTARYVESSTNKVTQNNFNAAVENRQNLQAELNELNAETGILASLKRAFVAPLLNRQLAQQDQNIDQIQRRRATNAINYNQQLITNTKVVENRSAKEMAQVVHNASVSKAAFDAFRLQGQLSKENILALSAQAGLTAASTKAFEATLGALKDENRFYLDAVNAEIVKLQLSQQEESNTAFKKATKNDKEYFELQQVALDQFLTESGREDMIGKVKAESLLTTGKKANDPMYSQFITWGFTTQSSALAPFSTFQRKLSTGAINPNDSQQLAVQREAKAVIAASNTSAQKFNDRNIGQIAAGTTQAQSLLDINDPKDLAKIDQLILEERALVNLDATSSFDSKVLVIPSLKAFKDNPTPEAKEELLNTFPKDILDYIESGKMDAVPTELGTNPTESLAATITHIASSYKDITQAEAQADMVKKSKALAGYYRWARKGLATTSMQGLTKLQFRNVESFRMGQGSLKDPEPFDITSEGQWGIRLKRAYIQKLQLDRLALDPAANINLRSF